MLCQEEMPVKNANVMELNVKVTNKQDPGV